MNKKPKNSIKERAKRIAPETRLRVAIMEHLFIHLGGRPDIPKIADLMIPFIEQREKEAFEAGERYGRDTIVSTEWSTNPTFPSYEQWKQSKNK